jgi:nitrite reductase/ring-hydroxylating ferredoxin subunit
MDLPPTLTTEMPSSASRAPPLERFPIYPLSWYLFCSSTELRDRPLTKRLLGRELVAFRTGSGGVAVLDARCSHLGADLGRGRVVGEAIQCPFHHWEYAPNGRCVRIPAQEEIPAFARQMAYPAAERHGGVFFFNSFEPLYPLPFFADCQPENFAAGRRFHFLAECSWYMLAANLFDGQHWLTQHKRQLLAPPIVDCPDPFARRIQFEASVVGSSFYDRVLRRLAGDTVRVSITCWGGTHFFATGTFRAVNSYIQVTTQPLAGGDRLRVDVAVFVRRGRHLWLAAVIEPLSLWLRRRFTHAFMREEFEELAGIRYSPHTLIDSDRELIDFFHWAASLPGPYNGPLSAANPAVRDDCNYRAKACSSTMEVQ